MPVFTCVNSTTGEVLYSGVADDLAALETSKVEVIAETAPSNTYWDGEDWLEIPARPSAAHTWNWGTKTWTDPRTLADHKATRMRYLKAARDEYLNGGFTWDGSVFDSNLVSQLRLLGLKNKAQTNALMVESWRLQDNTWRELDAEDALAVFDTFENHLRGAFQTFAALEAEVLAAETIEEIEEVVWP